MNVAPTEGLCKIAEHKPLHPQVLGAASCFLLLPQERSYNVLDGLRARIGSSVPNEKVRGLSKRRVECRESLGAIGCLRSQFSRHCRTFIPGVLSSYTKLLSFGIRLGRCKEKESLAVSVRATIDYPWLFSSLDSPHSRPLFALLLGFAIGRNRCTHVAEVGTTLALPARYICM